MASETNPNVNISSDQPVDTAKSGSVVVGGSNAVSFDALESAGVGEQPFAKKLTTKSNEEAAKEETAAPEVEAATSTPIKGDTTPKEGQEPVATKVEEPATEGPKSFKLKTIAGREVEVPMDAKIMKKIDGVEQEVSIKDAMDQYAGKVAYDKRFSELDKRDKAYIADREETESQLTSILQKAYADDVVGSLLEIVKISGRDPAPVFDNLRKAIIGDMDAYLSMTPEQREVHFIKKENDFLKRSKESESKAVEGKQAQAELDQQVAEMRETLNVSDEGMKKADEEIRANPEAYKAFDNPKGRVELAEALQRMDLATQALGIIDSDYAKDMDMVELAARKLKGFNGDAKAAAESIRVKMKLKAAGPSTEVLENLSKKIGQSRSGGPKADDASLATTTSTNDDYDPRGWDRL